MEFRDSGFREIAQRIQELEFSQIPKLLDYSQQQNALGYNFSIDGPRLEECFRSRKDIFEVSQVGVSQGGLVMILLLDCTTGLT